MSCGLSPYQYVTLSGLKYELALYHPDQLRRALGMYPGFGSLIRIGGRRGDLPLHAHSDGCIVQLHGSFDAFACATGHAFPDLIRQADRASFATLSNNARLR
jgi:hypothetical protein